MMIQYNKETDTLFILFGELKNTSDRILRREWIQDTPIVLDYDDRGKLRRVNIFQVNGFEGTNFSADFTKQYAGRIYRYWR